MTWVLKRFGVYVLPLSVVKMPFCLQVAPYPLRCSGWLLLKPRACVLVFQGSQ